MRNNTMKKLLVTTIAMSGLVAGSAMAAQLQQINFNQDQSNQFTVVVANAANPHGLTLNGNSGANILSAGGSNKFMIKMTSGPVTKTYYCTLATGMDSVSGFNYITSNGQANVLIGNDIDHLFQGEVSSHVNMYTQEFNMNGGAAPSCHQ